MSTSPAADDALRILSTLNEDGSRRWIKPKLSHGRFLLLRRIVAYILIAIFTVIPYLKLNDKPLILLDLAKRQFTLFGQTFLPTDTLLLALLLLSIFLTIFILTALFGRVWCGWACPQTVYMEFLFRPIERFFEGAPGRAKKGWFTGKSFSKPLKYIVYLFICIYLAHTFLAYFVGVDNLKVWMTRSPVEHPTPFLVMLFVTGLMMFDFGFFREQVCIIMCPYGRFQSVLLDRNSLIVSYDRKRGEPRSRSKRTQADVSLKVLGNAPASTGDCVDCGLCVSTCPTGIDIREGLQMECINCTQCIDACDAVMTKLKRPRGLIRYSSQAAISGEKTRIIRPRILVYPAILSVVVAAFLIVLSTKGMADVSLLRSVGRPFVELPNSEIGNPVKLKIVNRTDAPEVFRVEITGIDGVRLTIDENPVHLKPREMKTLQGMIAIPSANFAAQTPLQVTVTSETANGDKPFTKTIPFRLVGPGSPSQEQRP